jgi:hypothetical protein
MERVVYMNVPAAPADGGFFIPPATAAALAAPAIVPFFAPHHILRILHLTADAAARLP